MSSRDATHYQGEVEVIDAIEAWGLGYRLGNAVKYIARADRKGNRRADLIKARDYIERELTGEWPEPLDSPICDCGYPANLPHLHPAPETCLNLDCPDLQHDGPCPLN